MKLAEKNLFTGYANNGVLLGYRVLYRHSSVGGDCCVPDRRHRVERAANAGLEMGIPRVPGYGSLPLFAAVGKPLLQLLPGTLLRSPARLLYLSTFCAAVALGAGVDAVRRARRPRRAAIRNGLLIMGLVASLRGSLGVRALFIERIPRDEPTPEFQAVLDREADDGRIAQERDISFSNEDRYDDAGGFDSIFLSRYYRGLLALAGDPSGVNRQRIDASELPLKALAATGVRFVITSKIRTDLELVRSRRLEPVSGGRSRARGRFSSEAGTEFVDAQRIPESVCGEPAEPAAAFGSAGIAGAERNRRTVDRSSRDRLCAAVERRGAGAHFERSDRLCPRAGSFRSRLVGDSQRQERAPCAGEWICHGRSNPRRELYSPFAI